MKKVEIDRDLLYHYYIKENHNIEETANLMNLKYRTVQRAIKEFDFNKDKSTIQKQRVTNLKEKYGVENVYQLDKSKDKCKQTKLERYGDENFNNSEKQKQTMISRYGVTCGYRLPEVQEKIIELYGGIGVGSKEISNKQKQTMLDKYGVPYYYLSKEARDKNTFTISKINKEIAKILNDNNIETEFEFVIDKYSYDLHILNTNILMEINPSYTHNSTVGARFSKFEKEPLAKDYHFNKTILARDNNYRCIHIWDWDDIDKIVAMLKSKERLFARKLVCKEVPLKDTNEFLNNYHLQNTCKGQIIRLGLYTKEGELVQVMTFGKPRYNKKFEYELLRLCTKSDYIIVGGAKKLFTHFINQYKPESIISYCDNSKFNGNVYTDLGFNLKDLGNPTKHWFNGETHITDNLLRQRGFDQLFNTNYGKGTSNIQLMLNNGFIEIYDCGQSVYIWNNK